MNILDHTKLSFPNKHVFFMSYNVGLKRRDTICREALLQSMPMSYQYTLLYKIIAKVRKKLQLSFTLLHIILFLHMGRHI